MDKMNWEKDPDNYREEIQNSNYVITPIRITG